MSVLAAIPADLVVPASVPLVPYRATRAEAAAVGVRESEEPLVDVPADVDRRIHYDELPLPERGAPRLRASVVRRLEDVRRSLPAGFGLTLLDGWRSTAFQRALVDYYARLRPDLEEGFVSDPDDATIVAPHTTGGAVDVTLSWSGVPLALGTDYDSFEPEAAGPAYEAPGAERRVRDLRRLLSASMRAAGFAPYPLEWWHWSYGDQWWAADAGAQQAIYGPVR